MRAALLTSTPRSKRRSVSPRPRRRCRPAPSRGDHRRRRVLGCQPDRFAPERWLDADSAAADDTRFKADRRATSQPFSTKPRGCMGKNPAYLELRLVLAHLLLALCPRPVLGLGPTGVRLQPE